jgi:DNA-binding transcriptional LysR family regulator
MIPVTFARAATLPPEEMSPAAKHSPQWQIERAEPAIAGNAPSPKPTHYKGRTALHERNPLSAQIPDVPQGVSIETWITEGLIEVGIVSIPQSSGIDVRGLREEELCAIIPDGHRFELRSTVELQEILQEPLLIPRFGRDVQAQLFQRRSDLAQTTEEERPPLRHLVSDPASLCELVRAGLGIALLPRSVVPAEVTALKILPLTPRFPIQSGLGVARSWGSATPVGRLFADCAEAWIKENEITHG